MSVGIVIIFKIIQIHHGNAHRAPHIFDFFFVITAVEYTCQHVSIELLVIACQLINQVLLFLQIRQRILIQTVHQLHHVRLSIYFQISCDHLIDVVLHNLQLALFFSASDCLQCNAILTGSRVFPQIITMADFRCIGLQRFCFHAIVSSQQLFPVQEPHDRKKPAETFHFFLNLFFCYADFLIHSFFLAAIYDARVTRSKPT